jgi:hypothetical protein
MAGYAQYEMVIVNLDPTVGSEIKKNAFVTITAIPTP